MERPLKIAIETETPNDPNTLFRVSVDGKPASEHLTAVQTRDQIEVIIERLQRGGENALNAKSEAIESDALNASNDE
jgi:malate/lactate dehydrogenase